MYTMGPIEVAVTLNLGVVCKKICRVRNGNN